MVSCGGGNRPGGHGFALGVEQRVRDCDENTMDKRKTGRGKRATEIRRDKTKKLAGAYFMVCTHSPKQESIIKACINGEEKSPPITPPVTVMAMALA